MGRDAVASLRCYRIYALGNEQVLLERKALPSQAPAKVPRKSDDGPIKARST